MGIGVSIFLIAVGALLVFAVDYQLWWLDVTAAGWVLMIVGIVWLLLTVAMWGNRRRNRPRSPFDDGPAPPPSL